MDNIKNDKYYVDKIVECIDTINKFMENKTIYELQHDISTNNVVMFQIVSISNYSLELSEEFKSKKSNIAWQQIKGMRNMIVHDYERLKYDTVYETVMNDIQELREELLKV